jgi:putative endonuclease
MFKLTNKIGKIGEDTACLFLMKQGYIIKERNYWKKWGEIDIIAEKEDLIHFVEVKSVVNENLDVRFENTHRPEENVHSLKQKRLRNTISTYIAEKKVEEGNWQFDIIAVYLSNERKQVKIKFLENIIL